MENTIVYHAKKVPVTVLQTPLQAILSGGIMVRVSLLDTVILDASQSTDLDYPDATDLGWELRKGKGVSERRPCKKRIHEVAEGDVVFIYNINIHPEEVHLIRVPK